MQKLNMSTIDAQKLRLLVAVFDAKSITKAAATFNLNQSTISHTLERLRDAIGDPLFVKAGRGIEPTEKLVEIIPRIRSILAEIEGLVVSEDYDPASEKGAFAIAIPSPALLPEMRALQKHVASKAPGARLSVMRLSSNEDLHKYLEPGRADVAISLVGGKYSPVFNHQPFSEDRLVIFYDANCRPPIRTVEDYVSAQHAVLDYASGGRGIIQDNLSAQGITRNIALSAPTASMLGEFVVGTDLIATMPSRLGESVYSKLASCEPPIAFSPLTYRLVTHKRLEHSGRNHWIRKMVLQSRQIARS